MARKKRTTKRAQRAKNKHSESTNPMRPDVGTQAQLKKKKMARGNRTARPAQRAENYKHPESTNPMRPDVGTQAQFKKKKPPATYRYDSSLSPALEWDGQNPAREQGEVAIRQILETKSLEEAKRAAEQLKVLSKPFLNWAGKAE